MNKNFKRSISGFLAVIMTLSFLVLLPSCTQEDEQPVAQAYTNYTEGLINSKVADEEAVLEAIETVAESIGISDVDNELKVQAVNEVGEDRFYNVQQYINDIPVYGKSAVLVTDKNGNVTSLTSNTVNFKNTPEEKASATAEKLTKSIQKYVKEYLPEDEPSEYVIGKISSDNLHYYDVNGEAVLTYIIQIGRYGFVADAKSSKIIEVIEMVSENSTEVCYNADATEKFNGYYYDVTKTYSAYNKKRNIYIYNYLGNDSTRDTSAREVLESSDKFFGNAVKGDKSEVTKNYNDGVTFMNNISKVYDYFNNKFSEKAFGILDACYNDSYDNGENALGGIVGGKGYISMGSVMGIDDIDTIAHEYTHVVTRKNVSWINIPAWNERRDYPGAINEGYSDIFGELIEAHINNEEPDWVHGNRIIHDPMKNNYPTRESDVRYEEFRDNMWGMPIGEGRYTDFSHGFSTVISHSAYLMWNGIDGDSTKKIDEDLLAELWYRGMLMLNSDATFKQCANAINMAAQQMYKNAPEKFTIKNVQCVKEAFEKTGISTGSVETTVANGSTIAVIGRDNVSYADYNIKFEYANYATGKYELVKQEDVKTDSGYTFDLKDGTYCVTVKDNAENGSENEYSITIKVVNPVAVQDSGEVVAASIEPQRINIYTDFVTPVYATNLTLFGEDIVTLGELSVIETELTPIDATSYTIKWTSSDESVATVSPSGDAGIINTISKGETTITATLTSNGNTITKTKNIRVASKGRDTVLVLDVSGSMGGVPCEEMKKSAIQFCNDLLKDEYNNRVGIVFFDDTVTQIGLSSDLDMLIDRIENVGVGDTTNTEAALDAADKMLQSQSKSETIKNVVIMADGLPNEGEQSSSGSMPSGSYSGYYNLDYANAVIDTAKRMMKKYNMYSLGFFHSMFYDEERDFGKTLMQELTNKKDGYHQVDKAEDLKFAFGDISDDIQVGSKIVINIACPVDVTVSHGGEKLSSIKKSYNGKTTFGTLQLLGKNKDIKVVSLDSDKVYDVVLKGTGDGKMDYSVNYFDSNEKLSDYRSFEAVPITKTTIIKSSTDNSDKDISLNIDADGDGVTDEIWSAALKGMGKITYQKNPPKEAPEVTEQVTLALPVEDTNDNDKDSNDVVTVVLIAISVSVLIIVTVILCIVAGNKKKKPNDIEIMKKDENNIENKEEAENKEEETETTVFGGIEILNGTMKGFAVPMEDKDLYYLGKDSKYSNIVFSADYKNVSRMHCSVEYDAQNRVYYLTDLSSNGTYISNRRLDKGKRTRVGAGVVVSLANSQCQIALK